ncbi:MAG: LacI family transcriptional regulator [Deltaproteobacteria bacterium]|nr:LacI family transcriptional regulator [Deltaproteobacteria bacterium]
MNWIDLLALAVTERGSARVAKEIGLSRTTVHMALKGTYNADTKNIEQKVLEAYGKTVCPFLGRVLDGPECRAYRERPVPMSHYQEIQHWQTCQKCDAPVFPDTPVTDEE